MTVIRDSSKVLFGKVDPHCRMLGLSTQGSEELRRYDER